MTQNTRPQQPDPSPAATPPLDARSLDRESYQAHLRSLGISNDSAPELVGNDTRPQIDPRVAAAAQTRAAEAHALRVSQLEPGRIDGTHAEPAAVEARLRELGIEPAPGKLLSPRRQPLAAPVSPSQEKAARAAELVAATKRVRHYLAVADQNRLALDTRSLTPIEFEAFTQLRGLGQLPADVVAITGNATY